MQNEKQDILYQAAYVWKELMSYRYVFTYGYKGNLHTINLTFSPEDFPHLAGFQCLKDIRLPRYNPRKIVDMVLQQKITYTDIQKAALFHELVEPRLAALVQLKEALDCDFDLFTYVPRFYPFITKIKADYLIATQQEPISFVFIIKESPSGKSVCDYLCCSAFEKGDRDYRTNQQRRTLLKKTRIHIESQSISVLYNRLVDEPSATEESFFQSAFL